MNRKCPKCKECLERLGHIDNVQHYYCVLCDIVFKLQVGGSLKGLEMKNEYDVGDTITWVEMVSGYDHGKPSAWPVERKGKIIRFENNSALVEFENGERIWKKLCP